MSTTMIMMTTIFISSILCFISNSWIWIWIALEMNTLSFCSIMKTSIKNENKKMVETSMKYLIIQSISSAVLIIMLLNTKETKTTNIMKMSIIILMVKIASSPFHQWFVKIIKKSKIKNNTILMTWQKIAPAYLIMFHQKKTIIPFILISSIVGSISQMNKKKTMEIMAFSSIFNLSWMMMALTTNMKTLILFSMFYWMSVTLMMYMLYMNNQNKSEEMSKKNTKWMVILIAANLAGIPPTAGFMAKWLIINETLKNSSKMMITMVLTISAVNFYIYLRLFSPSIMKNTDNKQKNNTKKPKKLMKTNLLINSFPLAILTT